MIDLMREGVSRGYAVGAFNVSNMEYVQAVLEVASDLQSPVIMQAAGSELHYMGGPTLRTIVESCRDRFNIQLAINLDHGADQKTVALAIKSGFTSVMFDGSSLPYEENVRKTTEICRLAKLFDICVEGEIGMIGGADEMEMGSGQSQHKESYLADPDQCADFVQRTGIDCLAAAVGTAHGFYKLPPKLDFDRLDRIRDLTGVPLVLHGGTGVPQEDIRRAISLGVGKINFSTVVRHAFISQLRETLKADPETLDLMLLMGKSKERMKDSICKQIVMCKSDGRL